MSGRRWWRRSIAAAAAFAAVWGVGSAAHYDPDPLRVALLAAVGVLALGVLVDGFPESTDAWGPEAPRASTSTRGRDRTTAAHLRALEDHLSARQPTSQVRDRLARLADQALRTRHSVSRQSPAGRALLGDEVADVLEAPPRRLTVAGIRRCIDRIDEL